MKGPGLVVESSSFVEATSVMNPLKYFLPTPLFLLRTCHCCQWPGCVYE